MYRGNVFKKLVLNQVVTPKFSCWYCRYMEEIFWRVGELCYRLHLSTKNVFLSVEKVSRAMVNTHWKLGCIRQLSVHKCALFFLQTFQTFPTEIRRVFRFGFSLLIWSREALFFKKFLDKYIILEPIVQNEECSRFKLGCRFFARWDPLTCTCLGQCARDNVLTFDNT